MLVFLGIILWICGRYIRDRHAAACFVEKLKKLTLNKVQGCIETDPCDVDVV